MSRAILASQSKIRLQLLQAAGIDVEARRSMLDEEAAKQDTLAANPGIEPGQMAIMLAEQKALSLSVLEPHRLVIGADQILSLGPARFDKPKNMNDARAQLHELRGKTHHLETAVVCVQADKVLWHHLSRPSLTMRMFDQEFLDSYLQLVGSQAMETVGGYKLEGIGVQLFEKISGDYFSILGLPLLELLAFLRERGDIR